MMMLMPAQGAAIEPVVLDPAGPDCRGEWGHLGPFDFAIGVTNLERGVGPALPTGSRCTASRSGSTSGRARVALRVLRDPDGLYVSLVEARY